MLYQLDMTLWTNDVSFNLIGINFGNRMTCIQLEDGSFWLHSPTKFNLETYNEIKEKGNISYLVTPSLMHNLFVMDWKEHELLSQLVAPKHVKKVSVDFYFDDITNEDLNKLFNDEISGVPINGMPMLQEYAFIHHRSKTLILTDLAFNFKNVSSSWTKIFLQLYGAYNKFGPTITIRTLIRDKKAFRNSLDKILEFDFDRIIVSHGEIVETNGRSVFVNAFQKYL